MKTHYIQEKDRTISNLSMKQTINLLYPIKYKDIFPPHNNSLKMPLRKGEITMYSNETDEFREMKLNEEALKGIEILIKACP